MEPVSAPAAIILLAHGSPDPDWRRPVDAVRDAARRLAPGVDVVAAYLGHLKPSFSEAVEALMARGHRRIRVVALFLSPGGNHIKRDIPRLVEEVARDFEGVDLILIPGALGEEPEVIQALAEATVKQGLPRSR